MAAASKSTGSIKQFNVLYLILTLKNHSDKKHPITEKEILDHLNKDYSSQYGVSMDRSTLTRMLNALEGLMLNVFRDEKITETTRNEDLNLKNGLSFYLGHIKNKGTADQYYYESVLLESELHTLYDAIETYNYFCIDDIKNISYKLSSLRPRSKDLLRYIPSRADSFLKEDNLVLQHISELAGIIKKKQPARITYGFYNENLKLAIKKDYPKELLPLRLIWSNGYYYCIMGQKDYSNTVHLRVDRIIEIEPVENTKKADLKKYSSLNTADDNESKSDYRTKYPVMYSGTLSNFRILVNASANNMMNTIVDVFGIGDADIGLKRKKTVPVNADTAKKYHLKNNGEGWVALSVKCSEPGMELFATEYCRDVIIVSPDASAQRVKAALKEALGHYS